MTARKSPNTLHSTPQLSAKHTPEISALPNDSMPYQTKSARRYLLDRCLRA
jgi:hypothetical protein